MANQVLKPYISVVSPVYGCRTNLVELYIRLKETLEKISSNFEIILINDASPDEAWETIVDLAQRDVRVKGINLSRNFGQHYAITAGLDASKGEWVVVMDCDLQDKPEEILKLYSKAKDGFEIVFGRRYERKDTFHKLFFSKLFFSIFSYLTDSKQDHTVANFGIFHNNVISAILRMGDSVRVFPVLVQWVGFRKTYVNVDHSFRSTGKSAYSYRKLFSLAADMIISFSEKPLRLGMKFGILISVLSFLLGIFYFVMYLTGKVLVPGYASLIISISFSTGIIITFLGLVGLYIGKISMQVKKRPNYIIEQTLNI